ncbi:MAG: hypothetical protein ABW278_03980 [Steroidobacteraceae bacterium]
MRTALSLVLAACTLAAVASEAPIPANNTAAAEKPLPPIVKMVPPQTTCYFIRSLRPIAAVGSTALKSPFVPLQSRIAGVESQPTCVQGGQTIQAIR